MTDQLKNILIGLFVAAAITIALSIFLFLEPNVGDNRQILHVRFANISGINVGTRVTFAGKQVGEVSKISVVPNARESSVDGTGKVYLYELMLKLDSGVKIYKSDEVAIRTTGLMGERSVAILPKIPPAGGILEPLDNSVLYANSVDPLENTISQVAKVASRVDHWLVENGKPLSQSIQSFNQTMSRADAFLNDLEKKNIVSSLSTSLGLLNENMDLVKTSLTDDQLLHKAANLFSDLNQSAKIFNTDGAETLRHFHQIMRDIADGYGTVGRFVSSDDFYLRLSSVLGKVDTLMNDINHYGVLFQYDKSWKRNRTRKANLVQALDSPQEFRTYFEGEVDTIQTSLGRLTQLLERADDSSERQKILQSEPFKRDFGALLRQAQSLADSIKLYNENLVSSEVTSP